MGGHFLRLVLGVDKLVDMLEVVPRFPPPEAAAEAAEVTDYLMAVYDQQHTSAEGGDEAKSRVKYLAAVTDLCRILNGRPGVDGFRTFQPGLVDLPALKSTLKRCLMVVVLAHQPTVPSLNKWTKHGPSNDFWVIATLWDILPKLQVISWSELEIFLKKTVARQLAAARLLGADEADPETQVQVSWHGVAGTRYDRLDRVIHDALSLFIMTSNAVVLEPNRYLALCFMSMSSRVQDYSAFSPLLDLLHEPYSVVVICLQYYASLLTGQNPRLRLIWLRVGCTSLQEWTSRFPEQVHYFKRMVLHMIGQFENRHMKALQELEPFGLGDSRRSLESRYELARKTKTKDCV